MCNRSICKSDLKSVFGDAPLGSLIIHCVVGLLAVAYRTKKTEVSTFFRSKVMEGSQNLKRRLCDLDTPV